MSARKGWRGGRWRGWGMKSSRAGRLKCWEKDGGKHSGVNGRASIPACSLGFGVEARRCCRILFPTARIGTSLLLVWISWDPMYPALYIPRHVFPRLSIPFPAPCISKTLYVSKASRICLLTFFFPNVWRNTRTHAHIQSHQTEISHSVSFLTRWKGKEGKVESFTAAWITVNVILSRWQGAARATTIDSWLRELSVLRTERHLLSSYIYLHGYRYVCTFKRVRVTNSPFSWGQQWMYDYDTQLTSGPVSLSLYCIPSTLLFRGTTFTAPHVSRSVQIF